MVEWTAFCEKSGYSDTSGEPYACINLGLIICLNALLLVMVIFTNSSSSKNVHIPARIQGFSSLQITSAIFNSCVGIVYLFLGIWILEEKLKETQTALPLSLWFQALFQGFTCLLVGLTVSIRVKHLSKAPMQLLSVLAFLSSGFVCLLSLYAAFLSKQITLKIALDVLAFPGAILLLLCSCRDYKCEGSDESGIQNDLYRPLKDESNGVSEGDPVTPFAKARSLSRFSFWWLNSLMKRGREKTLEDDDIPKLSEADTAESCYLSFLEQLDKQKQTDPSFQPSILKTIILCHLKEICLSGFFALLKIIATSAGPLLLNAFILVAEGKESFKYEGYVLAISLFLAKCTESLSQRQWYFRTRLIGMKVKSLLTAAIYKKQMRLTNAARLMHSNGEIMNYVTVDTYRIGEFPFWFHQIWTTSLQLCISLVILSQAVGLATIAALVVIILTVICNAPLAKLQHKFQTKLMVAQDDRLKASSEALVNMKVLKLYAWETHFKGVIEKLRNVEYKCLSSVQLRRAYHLILFWTSPVLVSAVTFVTCYFLNVPLHANNVFTFLATLRLVQDPISSIPDVFAAVIQSKVSFARILNFLEEPELQSQSVRIKCNLESVNHNVIINTADFSWEENLAKPSLRNIDLQVGCGEKVAVCGEVGSGKSTLLAAILGDVPKVQGSIQVYGKIAYVSQTAWIQTGTVQDNILFGSVMDGQRYHDTLERCSLLKDLDLLPYGDLTEIGERGVNLSGGQKQRIQLARALYQNADLYLLDDPFSAVDAHTAKSLFNVEYVMEALSGKTVILVTHQVDFLPAFNSVLLMSGGEILRAAPYHQLLSLSQEFQDLVNAHKKTAGSKRLEDITSSLVQNHGTFSATEIQKSYAKNQFKPSKSDQLIKQEEREEGDMGLKPYKQYLNQNKGFLYFSASMLCHLIFVIGQIAQSSWMAANVDNPHVGSLMLIMVYLLIGFASTIFLVFRSLYVVVLGIQSSKSLFSQLQNSLFSAPMSFYDSTPLGRILSRVSLDLSIVDIDIPFSLSFAFGTSMVAAANLGVVAVITWQVLFVSAPTIFLALRLQEIPESGCSETNACINHALIICFDALLLVVLIFTLLIQNSSSSKKVRIPARFRGLSNLQIVSATLNTCIGLVYLFLGIWILEEKLRKTQTALFLISLWFQTIFQGFTWLLVGLTVSIRIKHLPKLPVRLLSILAFLFSGFVCVLSVFTAILSKDVSLKIALDVLSFPGAILLLLCAYRGCKNEENEQRGIQNGLFTSLNGEANGVIEIDPVTPFAKAGTLSRFSFWWLNSLMKRGREKTLEDEHIPKLSEADTAESCYLLFLEQLDKQKRADPSSQPSVLKTIILCHLKEIFVSGFFALVKTIATSAGPLLLNAFILVAEGKESFKYEGYVLAISLFLTKCIESLSQRQWYFRTRLIGMKVKSLLTAAIFKKQMRLSNAARLMHSSGEIMNYVTVDAYRIGEFPFWFHQIWTTSLQLCISLVILYQAVGLATIAALVCIILTVICNAPLAKLQHKFQTKLMVAQDDRLKASSEALVNMKVLKLYAWETHIKGVIEKLRNEEYKWLSSFQLRRAYNIILFWLSPVLVSAVTFSTCYFLNVPLHANNVFTFVATLRLVQDPISAIPDVLAAIIQAKVSLARIVNFLEEPELQSQSVRIKCNLENVNHNVIINSADFSWEENLAKPSLRNIDLQIACGDKVAVCGEVGSGKSTLLASILGEVPNVRGHIQVYGKIAYVSQTAWIQTGTVQDNILFGSAMDGQRYHETLERCSLVKDLDLLPYGDLTEIGERGVNFSGGQKQRIQLARALYQNADLYLLDDPFSAVDAHTAKSLFNEYVMEALSGKTVVLVTHQVDFLPAFDSVLLMSDGEILRAAPYHQLLSLSLEFQDLVNAHKNTAGSERLEDITPSLAKNHGTLSATEIQKSFAENQFKPLKGDQLIKHEEREVGDIGLKPYKQYLKQNKGFLYFSVSMLSHLIFVACQIAQSSWMAANVDNPHVSSLMLIMVYLVIGFASIIFVVLRSLYVVVLGVQSSKSLFSQLQNSLFNAPMSFYDSTPLGRILSRVSLDLSIVDIDIPFSLTFAVGAFMVAVGNLGVFMPLPYVEVKVSNDKEFNSS
ncbi:hypothetical protein FEM48_Zijuj03G0168000 [Ziziphus jujuba var. spinosa]|uniref:ABC-type xenobiotic transporter n=1 Tax=Ziziphus jujuba var. spinosa TaxID=714518 RepID=A0A978VRH0_ZIZJJ|nr:hypothetical protein FEM48_Zijuj03G0168000 [Ziziphus jujuba var. spinosa]